MDSTQFTSDDIDLEALQARLRKLTDEELIREWLRPLRLWIRPLSVIWAVPARRDGLRH